MSVPPRALISLMKPRAFLICALVAVFKPSPKLVIPEAKVMISNRS